MKNINLVITCLIFITSCSKEDHSEELKQEIISADLSMSDLAVKEGFFSALNQYATEDFVKLNEGAHPTIGKKDFEELNKDRPGPKTLTWKPEKADVSQSGDLGYTWGNWKFELPDTTMYGNYFTVWKKMEDGKWKMTLDGGNNTPAPK